jgi:hypothetical protein
MTHMVTIKTYCPECNKPMGERIIDEDELLHGNGTECWTVCEACIRQMERVD